MGSRRKQTPLKQQILLCITDYPGLSTAQIAKKVGTYHVRASQILAEFLGVGKVLTKLDFTGKYGGRFYLAS